MEKLYRQGDVLLRKIEAEKIPKDATIKDNVLAYGETTGHKHVIQGDADVLVKDGNQYVIVRQKTELVHEEHGTIALDQGAYQVVRQREYQPGRDRLVHD